MRTGPKSIALGVMQCPLCHGDMRVTTNKEGYPTAFCSPCRAQLQVRVDQGSLLLLGKVHEWQSPEAVAQMVDANDARVMYQKLADRKKPALPPHLSARSNSTPKASSKTPEPPTPEPPTPEPAPAPPKPKTFLGIPI
jgi:hypothetical protein